MKPALAAALGSEGQLDLVGEVVDMAVQLAAQPVRWGGGWREAVMPERRCFGQLPFPACSLHVDLA